MRPYLVAAVAVALLAGAPLALAAGAGVPAVNGNQVEGEIAPATDEDCFALPLVAGGTLTVKVAPPKGGTLLPQVRLRNPSGTLVPVDGFVKISGTGKLQVKNFPVGVTGTWSVCVRSEASTAGIYLISFATKVPKKRVYPGVTVAGDGSELFEAAGIDGAVLSFVVKEKSGSPVSGAEVRDPADAVVGAPGTVARKGKSLVGKGFALDRGFGVYGVLVEGSGGADTVVDCTVTVKFPKPDKTKRILGPEPRPTSMGPTTGIDGTLVTVSGTGFVAGATLYFGDTPAVDPVFDSATQIRGKAPPGAAATAGLTVKVAVENPDGQSNEVPGAFGFIGPPQIFSVDPAFTPLEGGLTHTVNGSGFRTGFTLLLGGEAPSNIVLVNEGQITFTGNPRAEGTYLLSVTDELARTGSLPSAITYVGPPTLTSVSPASASFTGGRTIRLTGTRLRSSTKVFFDGVEVTPTTAIGSTAIDFALPAGPAGTYDVKVRDEFDRETVLPQSLSRRGPFVQTSSTAVPSAPTGTDFFGKALALGDVDGDGAAIDLLVTSAYVRYDSVNYVYFPSTRILVNDGSGLFADTTASSLPGFAGTYDAGQGYVSVLGDLDGQPGDEAMLSNPYTLRYANSVFTRNSTNYAYYVYTSYGNYTDYQTYIATRVLANDGSGGFSNVTATALPNPGSTPMFGFGERFQSDAGALGDLDEDGDTDLFLTSANVLAKGVVFSQYTNGGTTFLGQNIGQANLYAPSSRSLIGDGSGGFTNGPGLPGPYYFTRFYNGTPFYYIAEEFSGSAVALGDLDGDMHQDAVVCRGYPRFLYYYNPTNMMQYNYYADATRILTNDGSGNFAWDPTRVPVAYGITNPGTYDYWQASAVALGDLDDDGDRDIVLGRGRAFYTYDSATMAYRLTPAIRVLKNDGTGRFAEATGQFLPAGSFRTGSTGTILSARSLELGDVDGDEVPDLVVAGTIYYVYNSGNGYGYYGLIPSGPKLSTKILINDGKGNLADRTSQWMPTPVNGDWFQADDATLGDLDGDGDADLVLVLDGYPYDPMVTSGTNRPLRVFENQ